MGLQSGTVTNSGTISGGGDGVNIWGGIGSVTNSGRISGDTFVGIYIGGGAGTVTTAGTISGTLASVVFAGSGLNTLTLQTGSVLKGDAFGSTASTTNALILQGSGEADNNFVNFDTLDVQASGVWTLGGNSAIGATTVQTGTLNVSGVLSSPVTVDSGGALAGPGAVGNVSILSGGIFHPGSGVAGSSMTVNGTLGLAAGSTYVVDINPSTSSFASVSGLATPGGASVKIASGSQIAFHQTYAILTAAGGVSGTFDPTVAYNSAKGTLSYDADDAYLTFTSSAMAAFLPRGSGSNNLNVGTALDKFVNNGGALPSGFGSLYSLPAPQLASALTQLSGPATTGVHHATFNAMNSFVGMFFDGAGVGNTGIVGGRAIGPAPVPGGVLAYDDNPTFGSSASAALAAVTPRDQKSATIATPAWSVWAQSYGGTATTGGASGVGSSATTSQTYGLVVGADYRLSPDTVLGFGLGGGGTNFGLANGLGGGRSDLLQAGAYALHNFGSAYVGAVAAYSWQNVTTNRTVTAGSSENLQAKFDANTFVARAEAGDRFATSVAGVTPYGALQTTTILLPSYAESALSGGSAFALSHASQTVTDTRTELGARFDKSFALTNALLTLGGRLAWAHDFQLNASAVATFQSLPGASFTVNGATPSPNSALVSAGAEVKWASGFSVLASFEGDFSSNTRSYGGQGTLRYAW